MSFIGKYKVASNSDVHKVHQNALFTSAIKLVDRDDRPIIYLDHDDLGTTEHLVARDLIKRRGKKIALVNCDASFVTKVRMRRPAYAYIMERISVLPNMLFMDHIASIAPGTKCHIGYDQQRCIHGLLPDLETIFERSVLPAPCGVLWITWRSFCNCTPQRRPKDHERAYKEYIRDTNETTFSTTRAFYEQLYVPAVFRKHCAVAELVCLGGNTSARGMHSSVFVTIDPTARTRRAIQMENAIENTYTASQTALSIIDDFMDPFQSQSTQSVNSDALKTHKELYEHLATTLPGTVWTN